MGDFNAQIGKHQRPDSGSNWETKETTFLIEWATSIKGKIINTKFQKKAGRTWTWKSPNDVTNTKIEYILTHEPDIVTYVRVISQVNIGIDHGMATSNNINRIKEDRVQTRTENPIRDTTRTSTQWDEKTKRNGDKQEIDYAQICKTITKKPREDIRKYNQ